MFAQTLFRPGADPHLLYQADPGPVMRPARPAKVRQIAACDDDEVNARVRLRIEARWRRPVNPAVFRIASSLVVLKDAEYRDNRVSVGGKWLLSGAGGNRIWTRHARKASPDEMAASVAEVDALKSPEPIGIRGGQGRIPGHVPFAVDLRNGYNFYHFMTEGMPQLAVIARAGSAAPIHVHLPSAAGIRGFVHGFIQAIYPQLAERIVFLDSRTRYDMVQAVYQHRHYLYQVADPSVEAAVGRTPDDDPWRQLSASTASRSFVAKNTIDEGQDLLAGDVRARLAGRAMDGVPERALVLRDPARGARDRKDQRAAWFEQTMKDLGFRTVYLERLSPLDQMALWSGARMVLAPHGAAFAHMFFAAPTTEAIEIGTPQTQAHRWGDFLQNAHVSRCRYTTIFADVSRAELDPQYREMAVPPIAAGHLGIRYSDRLAQAVEARVAAMSPGATGPQGAA